MELTLSFSKGDVAIRHDLRVNPEMNVDRTLTIRNRIMIDKIKEFDYDISRYTDTRFQRYIDEYNDTKSPCRQITKRYSAYLEAKNRHLEDSTGKTRKPTPLVLEFVVQVGNRDTNPASKDADEADIELNREFFEEFIKIFQRKYPHVEILLASFHADEPEGTPHLHLLVQFVGEGYVKGLSHQVSISKALQCDGFERGGSRRTGYSLSRWAKDVEDNLMEPLLKEIFHEDREILGEERPHVDTPIFRIRAKQEDLCMKEERENHQKVIDDMERQRDNLAADVSYYQMKTETAEKAYHNTRDDLRLMSNELVKVNGQLADRDLELKTKTEKTKQLDAEIAEKKAESASLDKEIIHKKDLQKGLSQLDDIEKQLNIMEVNMKKSQKDYEDPDKMIIDSKPAKHSFTGKLIPETVTMSRNNFNKLKSGYNAYPQLTGLIREGKKLLELIKDELKRLVSGKDSQERIEAMARAADIVKGKDKEIEKLKEDYDDLNDTRNETDTVLWTERAAAKERQEVATWDEYIRTQWVRGDDIPERTLNDLFRDIEWYRDNDKKSFKDIMRTVDEFKDDVIARSIEQVENDMLQERLRLLEEAKERKRKKKRNRDKSYDDHDYM